MVPMLPQMLRSRCIERAGSPARLAAASNRLLAAAIEPRRPGRSHMAVPRPETATCLRTGR